jgi:hypothetical protein
VTLLVETGVGVSYGGSMMHKNNPLRGGFLWFSSTFSLGVGIGILILCALGCTAPGRFIISVHEGEVQARVDKRFPIREKKMAFEIRLERPSVFFSQSGHVEIGMQVTGLVAEVPVGTTNAVITGKIRYDSDRHEFLFTDPHVKSLELSHMPAKYVDAARAAVDRVANRVLPAIPIYKLDPEKHRLERVLLKRAWVSDRKLFLEMGI